MREKAISLLFILTGLLVILNASFTTHFRNLNPQSSIWGLATIWLLGLGLFGYGLFLGFKELKTVSSRSKSSLEVLSTRPTGTDWFDVKGAHPRFRFT